MDYPIYKRPQLILTLGRQHSVAFDHFRARLEAAETVGARVVHDEIAFANADQHARWLDVCARLGVPTE